MRIFITGTGRCGTVTLSKALAHVSNMTVGHETRSKALDFSYPDNHIEVDPHLLWRLNGLEYLYPASHDTRYWFLGRDPSATIKSLSKRGSMRHWGQLAFMNPDIDPEIAARTFYQTCLAVMGHWERPLDAHWLVTPIQAGPFRDFWDVNGLEGDFEKALATVRTVYNASR